MLYPSWSEAFGDQLSEADERTIYSFRDEYHVNTVTASLSRAGRMLIITKYLSTSEIAQCKKGLHIS